MPKHGACMEKAVNIIKLVASNSDSIQSVFFIWMTLKCVIQKVILDVQSEEILISHSP